MRVTPHETGIRVLWYAMVGGCVAVAMGFVPGCGGDSGSHQPIPQITMEPIDPATRGSDGPFRIRLWDYSETKMELAEYAAKTKIRTFPELAEIETSIVTEDEHMLEGWITVTPSVSLEDRWYVFSIDGVKGVFEWIEKTLPPWELEGGAWGVRFRAGSEPMVRSIQVCDKQPDGIVYVDVELTENVMGQAQINQVVTMEAGGVAVDGCENSRDMAAPGDYVLRQTCPMFDYLSGFVLTVGPGFNSDTGLPLVQSGQTLEFSVSGEELKEVDFSCHRYYANPKSKLW